MEVALYECFLPRDAVHCAVIVIVNLSVRPSDYHTSGCAHMVRHTIMISSPYGRPMILVFGAKFRLHIQSINQLINQSFQRHDLLSSRSDTSGVGKNVVFSVKTAPVSRNR